MDDQPWVIKLGGSLLGVLGFHERLRAVLDETTSKPIVVVGGGATADVVRQWSQTHRLTASQSHWLAVRAMDFNRKLLEELLPNCISVNNPKSAEAAWKAGRIAILDEFAWLQSEESRSDSLPRSWQVTSDTIAAHLANRWQTSGLLLIKSIEAPNTWSDLIDPNETFVDAEFANHAATLPRLLWCNLRTESHPKITTLK